VRPWLARRTVGRRLQIRSQGLEDLLDRRPFQVICATVFAFCEHAPNKAALILSECGLSIQMLRSTEGRTLMTLPGMVELIALVTTVFVSGRKEGTFRDVDPISAREVFFGILEGTILGWLLASEPTGHYKASSARKVLAVVSRMIDGLR
jgi:AcrR family transcriptional regulator